MEIQLELRQAAAHGRGRRVLLDVDAGLGHRLVRLGLEMVTHPLGGLPLFALGTISSSLMLLAFLPPRRYLAWVRARLPEEV